MNILWHTHPTVTALLLLRDPTRFALAERAVRCFNAQDWPHCDLLVINASGRSFCAQEINLAPHKTTGFLRNMAIECARGEWCVWWADDCWFDPGYIRAHMLSADRQRVTVMNTVTAYGVDTQRQFTYRAACLAGFFRMMPHRYPDDGRDEPFLRRFSERQVVDGRDFVLKFVRERADCFGQLPEAQLQPHPA